MNIRLLSIFKTIRLQQIISSTSQKRRVLVYRNTTISVDRTAKIILGTGNIHINRSWCKRGDRFPFLLAMGEGATMEAKGSFDFYSGGKIYINSGASLRLGSGYANHNINICVSNSISIGMHCMIGENVVIRDDDNHMFLSPIRQACLPIVIGNHVWIGMNVIILKGVTIGDDSVIAAGSVVTRDIPPHSLAAGVPAKIVRTNIEWK